ncbi:Uncharacterised protein [Enterobacter cloacae]|nr:Uncharacterised protein [Enterobacter cloacae]
MLLKSTQLRLKRQQFGLSSVSTAVASRYSTLFSCFRFFAKSSDSFPILLGGCGTYLSGRIEVFTCTDISGIPVFFQLRDAVAISTGHFFVVVLPSLQSISFRPVRNEINRSRDRRRNNLVQLLKNYRDAVINRVKFL